jgi:hypothetical protein
MHISTAAFRVCPLHDDSDALAVWSIRSQVHRFGDSLLGHCTLDTQPYLGVRPNRDAAVNLGYYVMDWWFAASVTVMAAALTANAHVHCVECPLTPTRLTLCTRTRLALQSVLPSH